MFRIHKYSQHMLGGEDKKAWKSFYVCTKAGMTTVNDKAIEAKSELGKGFVKSNFWVTWLASEFVGIASISLCLSLSIYISLYY